MSNRRTALYDRHVAAKARVVPFAGWDMPVQYTGIAAEHKAVRTAAGIFDVSHMARLSFGGPDALALLEAVFTNSVATMKDGQVRYGLVCNEAGGILDDILVYRWPYGFAAVVNASNREKIAAWLDRASTRFAASYAPTSTWSDFQNVSSPEAGSPEMAEPRPLYPNSEVVA